jgi:hypothetical protein
MTTKQCMDALRLLARQAQSVNCVPLAEQRIMEYLQAEAHTTLTASLQKLTKAIDREAAICRRRGAKTFWITMLEFVRTMLPDETEDWDKD